MTIRKSWLLASTTLGLAALISSAAAAQDVPTPGPIPEPAQPAEVEALVITGSRIRQQDFTASNPVVSVGGEALENEGVTNLTQFLQETPALVNSVDLQDNADAGNRANAGLNFLNLRNLGEQRTLVLVNGRRHVAGSPGEASVDVNTIPVALIDRIEVLTGGASAIYGADGVSGVVNFILKDDFEGVDLRIQRGWTEDGGGENFFGTAVVGHNFMDGRANLTLAAEYSDTKPIDRDERHYSRLGQAYNQVQNPAEAFGDDDPTQPDYIFARDVRYIDTSLGGSVYTNWDFGNNLSGIDFQANGQPWQAGTYAGDFFAIGGSGTPLDIFQTELTPGLERKSISGSFGFDITDNHRFFAEGKFVRSNTSFLSQPTFDYGIVFLEENPFIPANILAAASVPDPDPDCAFTGTCLDETGLFFTDGAIYVARDNLDLGEIRRDIERDTFRTVVGLEGEILGDLNYEVSFVYGRTKETNIERNNRINERWYAALDVIEDPVTNEPVCRSNLFPNQAPTGDVFLPGQSIFNPDTFGSTFTPGPNSGCVPINIFGGPVSREAREWVNTDTTDTAEITQKVLTAYVSGDTQRWFSLPAGPIGFAIGGEWRREESDYRPDPILIQAADVGYDITWLGQARPETGAFEVKEAFAEVSVPILEDMPFARSLSVDAAYRYSEYSLSGAASSWKYGGKWQITEDVMLRATQARAVRAPNISELFLPESQTFELLDDPCDSDFVNEGRDPAQRLANCQAALGPLGLDPTTYENTFSASVPGVISGNRELEPETADTTTFGIVFTPRFVPGLSVALDYYDIELKEAINFFEAQDVVNNCYDLPQPNVYCTELLRNTDLTSAQLGQITNFRQFGQNVASYTTSGYDLTVRYSLDPADLGIERDIGRFQFGLVANKLEDLTFTEIAGEDPDEDLGEPGAPEWQVNFDMLWTMGPWSVNYGYTWFDETIREPDVYDENPDYFEDRYKYFSERSTHDIQVRYEIEEGVGLYAGVNNFTNQEPDIGALQTPVGAEGRFFYVGATMRLGQVF